jgi:DNA repair protein RecO (recombination protein O)
MSWDDVGFLVSKNKYNENSLITEIFTKDHGKVSGIIFGGTSKKIKKLSSSWKFIIYNI